MGRAGKGCGWDREKRTLLDFFRVDHLNPPAVASFPLAVALPQPQRGNDALRIALVATAVVVHRPCVVAEADNCPAADRTGSHRRHGHASVQSVTWLKGGDRPDGSGSRRSFPLRLA